MGINTRWLGYGNSSSDLNDFYRELQRYGVRQQQEISVTPDGEESKKKPTINKKLLLLEDL